MKQFLQTPLGRYLATFFWLVGVIFVVLETVRLIQKVTDHLYQNLKGVRQ